MGQQDLWEYCKNSCAVAKLQTDLSFSIRRCLKMKAFEDWWKHNKERINDIISDKAYGEEKAAEIIWRAAFEEIKTWIENSNRMEYNVYDEYDYIKEELENGNRSIRMS